MYPILVRLAYRYTKNIQDSEDIVQQVFLKLCSERILLPESAKAYLLVMTKNSVLNYIRDHSKEIKSFYVNAQNYNDEFQILFEDDVKIKEVHVAINKLPPRQKEIALLRCFGFSNREIASRLDLSLNTVNSHLRGIKHNLKIILSEAICILLLFLK